MSDFYLSQMDDSFTEGLCFDNPKEGKGERRFGAPPFREVPRRGSLAASGRGRAKGRSPDPESSDPMREAGAPNTRKL
jgi:hypothetical protein